ncbi:MAG: DNA replication/repair protein RecF [Proteobacteria bacterium]|nr:DNA replication/repair protein RecF [Pseudomonadota bacterium]MBS0464456.1 DNA replication/repair protein RecF [Pseudomonadota bacterium]
MQLTRLTLARFRGFAVVEWQPQSGINLITGQNGAGKTSLLEAAHLLANGRSFRGRVRDGLVRHGEVDLEVFAQWHESDGRQRRAGLRHGGGDWDARLDGQAVANLADLCAALAVLTFEPGSHALIAEGSEHRRRFMDWALFHVEPEFLPLWRRYARAVRQRNALLKSRPPASQLEPWEQELAAAGEPLARMRGLYLERLDPWLRMAIAAYLPELGTATLRYAPGWKRDEQSLTQALLRAREREIVLGHGTVGPHRADWRIDFERLPGWNALSRGQEKLLALACVLAQAQAHAAACGHWPVLALDDLASELDQAHQRRVLDDVAASGAQVLLTGTEPPAALGASGLPFARFHVEQGELHRLV